MSTCVTQAQHDSYMRDCATGSPAACGLVSQPVCPTVTTEPTIDPNQSGITLLGVYRACRPQPTILASYPPTTPLPNEARAEVALQALRAEVGKASAHALVLESRARRARKLELGWGFWLGIGLCGTGAAALYLRGR